MRNEQKVKNELLRNLDCEYVENQEEYREGYSAYHDENDNNPYPWGSLAWALWIVGKEQAAYDD